jgi:tRNA G18 (ribose-2'-O)-methylase SpoU
VTDSLLPPAETDTYFRIEGRHAVRAALGSSFEVVVLIDDEANPDPEIQSLSHRVRGPVLKWRRDALSEWLGFDYRRGVVAMAKKPERSLAEFAAQSEMKRVVVLDRLADPGNVGTIIRNAAAFGFDAAICSSAGASPYNGKAVRASATALFRLPVFVVDDWRAALAESAPATVTVATCLAPDAMPLDAFVTHSSESIAVVFGGEADGLSPEALAACTHRITIPIDDSVESLNVASASAIILHALRKTRFVT